MFYMGLDTLLDFKINITILWNTITRLWKKSILFYKMYFKRVLGVCYCRKNAIYELPTHSCFLSLSIQIINLWKISVLWQLWCVDYLMRSDWVPWIICWWRNHTPKWDERSRIWYFSDLPRTTSCTGSELKASMVSSAEGVTWHSHMPSS